MPASPGGGRFGQSPVVWISLLAVILFLSFIWIRQTTHDTTTLAFDDLVLTDMWMPNLDGKGLVRAIRKDPALASTCVIVVTADVEMRTKAVDMGFDDILLKPVTTERLAKTLAGDA